MIQLAETDDEIASTFPVMRQLRPHLREGDYVSTVRRMAEGGYRLAFVVADGEVRAVAGFRYVEMLARGRSIYVDDLVTDEASRSMGHGEALLDWLRIYARDHECGQFHLDSGVQRARAHAFYFRNGMHVTSFHFAMPIEPK